MRPLQVCALSLYSKIQQSVSEIGESLWRIPEIFPFCRDASRRRRAISTGWDRVSLDLLYGTKPRSPTSRVAECLLLAVKQKCREQVTMSLNDPCGSRSLSKTALQSHKYLVPLSAQSIFSASALTIGAQRATSAARDRRNFSGFESRVSSIPASTNICL